MHYDDPEPPEPWGWFRLRDPDHDVDLEVWGLDPTRAEGRVRGREFRVLAFKHECSIEVADGDGVWPSDDNWGSDGFYHDVVRRDAGWMSFEATLNLVVWAVQGYLETTITPIVERSDADD